MLRWIRSRVLYTPPVTPWKFIIPEAGGLTLKEGAIEGRIDDWGEVVTRYPYENVGMDHLLSREKDLYVQKILNGFIFKKIIDILLCLFSF